MIIFYLYNTCKINLIFNNQQQKDIIIAKNDQKREIKRLKIRTE